MKDRFAKQITLGQVLNVLNTEQEILVVGRTGNRKTDIETAKYISKTERILLNQPIEKMSIAPDDTYLIIQLVRV